MPTRNVLMIGAGIAIVYFVFMKDDDEDKK